MKLYITGYIDKIITKSEVSNTTHITQNSEMFESITIGNLIYLISD